MAVFAAVSASLGIDENVIWDFLIDRPENRMQEIIPGKLYLGNQVGAGGMVPLTDRTPEYLASTLRELQRINITHICCLAEGLCMFPDSIKYLQLNIADHDSSAEREKMTASFDLAFDFIEEAAGACLVHCNAGASRSPSIVAAYLMRKNAWTYKRALEFLLPKRGCVSTSNFEASLLEYQEKQLPHLAPSPSPPSLPPSCPAGVSGASRQHLPDN